MKSRLKLISSSPIAPNGGERKGFIRAHQLFPHFCKNKSVHSQKLIFSAAVEAAKKIIIYLGCDSGCQRSHILNRKCLQTLAWKIEKQIILSFHLCWKFFMLDSTNALLCSKLETLEKSCWAGSRTSDL